MTAAKAYRQFLDMNVVSVTYHESGLRTLCVDCEGCGSTHEIVWRNGTADLGPGELPCGFPLSGVEIPAWAYDARHRTGFRKYPQKPHHVFAGKELDDNAINDPARNWEE